MAKNALRELSRRLPNRPEIDKILNSLQGKDDMHVAVMAVSIVEAHLEKLIVTRLHRSDKEFLNRLFDNKGPLSDFSSKILVAEAFGLLTRPLAEELHVMRAIRNAFAHAKMPISFDMEILAKETRKLRLITTLGGPLEIPGPDGNTLVMDLAPKRGFLLAIRITLMIMDTIAKKKSSANKVIGRALGVK
jgi:DNA-binding MltR family transcriptional regulator